MGTNILGGEMVTNVFGGVTMVTNILGGITMVTNILGRVTIVSALRLSSKLCPKELVCHKI